MNYDMVKRIVIAVILDYVEGMGEECPELNDDSVPMIDVPNFDSVSALQATLDIEKKIKCNIGYKNLLFFDGEFANRTHCSLVETVNRILQIIENE